MIKLSCSYSIDNLLSTLIIEHKVVTGLGKSSDLGWSGQCAWLCGPVCVLHLMTEFLVAKMCSAFYYPGKLFMFDHGINLEHLGVICFHFKNRDVFGDSSGSNDCPSSYKFSVWSLEKNSTIKRRILNYVTKKLFNNVKEHAVYPNCKHFRFLLKQSIFNHNFEKKGNICLSNLTGNSPGSPKSCQPKC